MLKMREDSKVGETDWIMKKPLLSAVGSGKRYL
jgi:hypothetical protein